MKIVLDTNVLVSAIVFGGKPKDIIVSVVESGEMLCISTFVKTELRRMLAEKFSFDEERLAEVEHFISDSFIRNEPTSVPKVIKRDLSDNNVLALATFVAADYIVSGDNDLLELGSYQGISILTPHQFLDRRN